MFKNKIKLLIADDHTLLRDGLKAVFQTENVFEVIGEASDGEMALMLAKKLKPDVIVLDINMPRLNGIEVAKKIREEDKEIKILILSMHDNEKLIVEAVSVGINGYVLKMSDMEEFIEGVKEVYLGKDYFPTGVAKKILSGIKGRVDQIRNKSDDIKPILTKREKEIINLIVAGLTSQEIAEKLFISYFTVGKHRKNIIKKLRLKNTADLVRYALNNEL